jgi:hypothetical protein
VGFLKQKRGSEVTIKKLYLDEFYNVITVEGGNSMLDNLVIRGVGLSASADAKQNTDELIKRWNAYDANQQEIAELKSQLDESMAEAKETALFLYETHYKNDPDSVPFELLDTLPGVMSQIDNMISGLSRTQRLQSVKADAIKEAAFKLDDGLLISPHAKREMMEYAMELEGKS